MEEKEVVQGNNDSTKVSFTDILVLVLTAVYIWDWLEYPGLHASRLVAVAVLAIWWTLFVLKVSKR